MIFSDRDPIEKIDRQSQYILDHMIEDPLFVDPNDKISIVDHLGEDQVIKKIILFTSGSTKILKQYCSLGTLIQMRKQVTNIPFEHGHTWLCPFLFCMWEV